DELQIFNIALSAEQIANLYEGNENIIASEETTLDETWQSCVTPNDGIEDGLTKCSNSLTIIEATLELHYKFDEGTGQTVADTGDYSRTGTIGDSSSTESNDPTWQCEQNSGWAMDFDSSQTQHISTAAFTPPPETTIAFWMRRQSAPTNTEQIFGFSTSWEISHMPSGQMTFNINSANGPNTTAAYNSIGSWTHFAATFSVSTGAWQLYINGSFVEDGSFTQNAQPSGPFLIGGSNSNQSSEHWDGQLEDFRIYSGTLSAAAIATLAETSPVDCFTIIDHIEILNDGNGLTCLEESISIKACAVADCSSVATEDIEVTLSATGETTTWSSNPVTIPANSSGVDVTLTHRVAETITLSASTSAVALNDLVCNYSGCDLVFSDAGYILTLTDHNSCEVAELKIQAVQLDETGTTCAPAYTGAQSVNFSYDYSNPETGSTLPVLDSSNMAAENVVQSRSITFDSAASAALDFAYQDAGQLTITVADNAAAGL
ncbi:MAG: LamG domain-containing protein, partial [Gammaproteobacteria bacterium]|nr:LamG domain-containing protein [Gammaproteobacteria bacterium]